MENVNTRSNDLTAVEAFFLDAGLPVTEVAACPVPDCVLCADPLPRAA